MIIVLYKQYSAVLKICRVEYLQILGSYVTYVLMNIHESGKQILTNENARNSIGLITSWGAASNQIRARLGQKDRAPCFIKSEV